MKKLIAILVVFAMVTGAAFAQATVSGGLDSRWTILRGEGDEDPVTLFNPVHEAQITLSVQNDEGTAGGMMRLTQHVEFGTRVFAWWRPIEQVQLFLGRDGDGRFEAFNVARWGFHQGTKNVSPDYWWVRGYISPTWDDAGFAISIYPIDMLTVNLALRLPTDPGDTYENVFENNLFAQFNLNLDFGSFVLTYKGSTSDGTALAGWRNVGDSLNFTFHSRALVEGLNLGFGFTFADLQDDLGGDNQIALALAADYSGGDWGVKFRMFVDGFDTVAFPLIGIMPYYNFGFLEARFNFEILGISTADDAADPTFVINPYIIKNIGPVGFRLGLIYNTAGDGSWSVPLGVTVGF